MSQSKRTKEDPTKAKSKPKPKEPARPTKEPARPPKEPVRPSKEPVRPPKESKEPIDDTFDAMLDSAAKVPTDREGSTKPKSARRPMAEAASGWSNDMDDDEGPGGAPGVAALIQRNMRPPMEGIIAGEIPTIPMDEVDDPIDADTQIITAPEFSIYQIASFKQIEKEFSREHTSQYIDSKIDIGILYHHLHLQENLDAEDQKSWDWDKLFVEVRNSITNPTLDS